MPALWSTAILASTRRRRTMTVRSRTHRLSDSTLPKVSSPPDLIARRGRGRSAGEVRRVPMHVYGATTGPGHEMNLVIVKILQMFGCGLGSSPNTKRDQRATYRCRLIVKSI